MCATPTLSKYVYSRLLIDPCDTVFKWYSNIFASLSFLKTELKQSVEILPHERLRLINSVVSIPQPLMTWRRKGPGHVKHVVLIFSSQNIPVSTEEMLNRCVCVCEACCVYCALKSHSIVVVMETFGWGSTRASLLQTDFIPSWRHLSNLLSSKNVIPFPVALL